MQEELMTQAMAQAELVVKDTPGVQELWNNMTKDQRWCAQNIAAQAYLKGVAFASQKALEKIRPITDGLGRI